MIYTVRLSARAQREIAQALAWTKNNFGKKQSDIYKKLIRGALLHLSTHPLKAPSRAREDIGEGVRSLHIARIGKNARHFFIYRIVDNRLVDVARLLHDSMDVSGLVL